MTWKAKDIEFDGMPYALNEKTNEIYTQDSYLAGNPIKVADLEIITDKDGKKNYKIVFI